MREIRREAVFSGDAGTHTCTATAAGVVKSANINFMVKGKHKQLWNNHTSTYCNYDYWLPLIFILAASKHHKVVWMVHHIMCLVLKLFPIH